MQEKNQLDKLLEKYHLLEKKKEEYKTQLDQLLFAFHSSKNKNPIKYKNLEKQLQEKQKEYECVKNELLELNHFLEKCEEEMLDNSKKHENALEMLFSKDSQQKKKYDELCVKIEEKEKVLEKIKILEAFLSRIQQNFRASAHTLEASKKRTLLDWIFGRNPKVVVANYLFLISEEGKKMDKILENHCRDLSLPISLKDNLNYLRNYLQALWQSVQKPWASSTFEEQFWKQRTNFCTLFNKIEKEKKKLLMEKKELENEKLNWANNKL